ncbi:MAG: DHHA1 domain-containing protein, partial [bacterium]
EERLRFDFSHFDAVTSSQLANVEALVNQQIRANAAADIATMSMDAAREKGAMALFGEKYGDEVRVVQMGFSTELCGGTHVERTGDIGLFKIISEGGVAAGVRRIEAVTGENALQLILETEQRLQQAANLLKAQPATVEEKLEAILQKNRALEKELAQLKGKLASQAGSDLASNAVEIAGINVLAAKLDGVEPKSLRDTVDQLKNKLGKAIIVLGTVANDKVSLVAGVTKAETKQIKAGNVVNHVAKQVGGKGGGRPDMAMAGGNNAAALDGALASVPAWVTAKLSA